jgi:hypothetical protein
VAAQVADLMPAYSKLRRDAEKALAVGPFSVMDKPAAAPSGANHDYYSLAPYWWPNPATRDGLPYVRRDGEVNPERDRYDATARSKMENNVITLALAYFFSGDERFAGHACQLLRVWFLDPATRMNPHLTYSQAVPGRPGGRGAGIIEGRMFSRLVDAIALLTPSSHWTTADQQGLTCWFQHYLQWLLTSPQGQAEAAAPNNHGSWYDVQVAAIALFVNDEAVARRVLTQSAPQRIANQIAADGSQPNELMRTRSLSYSIMNLTALMDLADLAGHYTYDLWQASTVAKAPLRHAVDYLVAHAVTQSWSQTQITATTPADLLPILLRAASAYPTQAYHQSLQRLALLDLATERSQLLYYTHAQHRK